MSEVNCSATAADVAAWMLDCVRGRGVLYLSDALKRIAGKFGTGHLYISDKGNPGISKETLAEFRRLGGDAVSWNGDKRCWRFRRTRVHPYAELEKALYAEAQRKAEELLRLQVPRPLPKR